ncbi:MAG: hypothetical protein KJZ92_12015 [Rhodocyclaceae bacterium]|nr:hypothetical protein [Rhodocyclaceae bacterium]
MGNALAGQAASPGSQPPDMQDAALRRVLEEARQLAEQSRLLALNTAFESAGAAGDDDALGGEACHAADEAAKVIGAVERLLQQIQSAASLPGTL